MNPLCDLENSIEKITQPGQNLVIAGDFNCGDVDWDSSTVKPGAYDRAPNQKLLDLANNCSLTNVQQQATRRGRALDICGYSHPGFLQGIRHGFSSQTDLQTRSLWYKRKHP